MGISYIFSKQSFSYRKRTPTPPQPLPPKKKTNPYISGNETLLYFRKLLIFQEVTYQTRKIKKTHS